MYVGRIEIPVVEAREPRPVALKLCVGLIAVPFFALIMLPWLAVISAWVLLAGGARLVCRGLAQLRDTLVYAGEVVVGR